MKVAFDELVIYLCFHFTLFTENVYYVALDKAGKQSFGICVLSGQVRDAPNSKTSGIFIKGIVPDSPADSSGKLNVSLLLS